MITKITLENFKSFGGSHSVSLGPLTLMVGTNASGKSNVRDALRLLHGVARGYSLAEVLGEKYGEGGVLQWRGIRGGISEVVHGSEGGRFKIGIETRRTTQLRAREGSEVPRARIWSFRYELELSINAKSKTASISGETLWSNQKPVFSTQPDILKASQSDDRRQIIVRISKLGSRKFIGPTLKLRREQPLVSQLSDHPEATSTTMAACRAFLGGLESVRFLDLDPQALRRPSLPGQVVFGDKGENLSSVLQALCDDKQREEAFIEWTRELTPLDVAALKFLPVSLDGKVQLALVEKNGRIVSAESASDGTLRFLAFAAALLGTKPAETYVFEEIENGIHPNRVNLLLELLVSATKDSNTQVIATTHSPALLNFLRGKTLKDALLVTRSADSSQIRAVGTLPMAEADKALAGDLLESGWFENISAFLNADEAEKEEAS